MKEFDLGSGFMTRVDGAVPPDTAILTTTCNCPGGHATLEEHVKAHVRLLRLGDQETVSQGPDATPGDAR